MPALRMSHNADCGKLGSRDWTLNRKIACFLSPSDRFSLTYWRLIACKNCCVQYAGIVPSTLHLTVGAEPEREFIAVAKTYRIIVDLRRKFRTIFRPVDVRASN